MTPDELNAAFHAPPKIEVCPACKDAPLGVIDGQKIVLCLRCANHVGRIAGQSPLNMSVMQAVRDGAHREGQRVALDHTSKLAAQDLEAQARGFEDRMDRERGMRVQAEEDADYYRDSHNELRGDLDFERSLPPMGRALGIGLFLGGLFGFMVGHWLGGRR